MNHHDIISRLPYTFPFLFVDELLQVDDNGASGHYTFPEDSYFYQGHFKDNPVTPGVILTECMAQIGVVCLGMLLLNDEPAEKGSSPRIAMSSTEIDFFLPVLPGEKVKVTSEKMYFRFNKLKCKVEMYNVQEKLIARGTIAGMLF